MRLLALCCAVFIAACIDFGTDPNEIGSISFDGIPYPAVVAGDTLRNEAGQVAPLRATVRTGAGDTIANPSVQFFTRDTTITLTADGRVLGRSSALGVARLFATADGLQSVTREIDVVRLPDTVVFVGAPDTLVVSSVDTTNNSGDFRLRLLNKASGAGVKGFLVRYILEFRGAPIAPGDTTRILLVDEAGRPSVVDTTDGGGEAGRRVHVRVPQLSGTSDSAVVRFRVSAGAYPAIQREFRHVLHIRPR
ncbi:MAG TPA: hypothetical protein VJ717_06025 [Gemmatimonadaceae bacterium]|nr:hypothetical protein [Gemmatimonadaceae bacterium]